MDTLSPIGKSAEPAITSYLAYLAREGRVEQIHFLLVQHATESCLIPKSLGDITRLPANIQKKWLESCFEKLKSISLKDKNICKVVNLPKRRRAIKNCWIFNIKSVGHYRSCCKRIFLDWENWLYWIILFSCLLWDSMVISSCYCT